MKSRTLGTNGTTVGAIGLGTGPLSIPEDRPTIEEGIRLLTRAAELGVTLWDTADAYCFDDSEVGYGERLCQKALAALPSELREQIVIATKGGTIRPGGDWKQDGRPEYLKSAIEVSLQALQTDCIALWQLHIPDTKVPFEDSLEAIAQAHQEGKIRLVGLSNVSVAQIEAAIKVLPLASVQNHYSFTSREPEQDGVLDKCRELNLAFLPYSPLGGMGNAKDLEQMEVVTGVAQELNASPQQIVLAWLLHKYDGMIPIPGMSRMESLEDSARASEIVLTPQQLKQLNGATLDK